MAYVNTGFQRSLTMQVDKKVGSISLSGYPKTYNGLDAFGTTYGSITQTEMAQMSLTDFEQRLSDFQSYVSDIEGGIDFDTQTTSGYEARRVNTTACPIPSN